MFRLVAVIACLFVSIDVIEGARAQSPPLPGKEDPVCGAKCLYVILRAFGKAPDSLRKIVAELGPASKNGYSLQQLRECALDHQLFAECVELGKDELGRFCKSNGVIIHLNEAGESTSGHYVLCEGVTESGVTVFDGDGSAREVSNEILDVWTGRTLIVSRNPIDLRAGFQTNQISLLAYAFGAAVLGIGLFVLVKVGGRNGCLRAAG